MLQRKLDDYIKLRRATGFKFLDGESGLRGFVRYAKKRGDRRIRAETVIAWASQANCPLSRHKRMRVVTRFAEFLRAEDPRHELPPQDVFYARAVRPAPYVFSKDEIARVVGCAAQFGPKASLRPLTFSTLFGLLAVTGMRVSEALNLRFKDINEDGLTIRETKFRKSRMVPLHETTAAALKRYISARRRIATDSDHLFISRLRGSSRLSQHEALRSFRRACEHAGVGRTATGGAPRLHDLRHSFAVHALERCPAGRDRVERHMVALTTYLGHARVESTYWYLERTPRLLKDIAAACEAIAPLGAP